MMKLEDFLKSIVQDYSSFESNNYSFKSGSAGAKHVSCFDHWCYTRPKGLIYC